jgi:hypothetical protein
MAGEIVRKGWHACRPPVPWCNKTVWHCLDCGKYWLAKLYPNPKYDHWTRLYWLGRKLRRL